VGSRFSCSCGSATEKPRAIELYRMRFLSRLFARDHQSSVQRTTADRPLRIANPAVGFLNHAGAVGALLSQADQRVLSPLFKEVRTSEDLPPRCDVLFLYCTINVQGTIFTPTIRELIKSAGACGPAYFKKRNFTYDSGNAPSNKSDGCKFRQLWGLL
jgi:hypothetical protein